MGYRMKSEKTGLLRVAGCPDVIPRVQVRVVREWCRWLGKRFMSEAQAYHVGHYI